MLREAGPPPEGGDPKHSASTSRDLTLPVELRKHPRYKIGKFLGSGGMGVVFQAEHRLMDRIVALKLLHRDLMRNPRVLQRFRQEVKAAARLTHPNIVTAYDADHAGDYHFLVMEYVDGVSLDRLVAKSGPLEPAYACYFVRQAAKGLAHAYQAGMVHRDIKPQNLMLTRKGQVKILDFGLARLASESREEIRAASSDEAIPAGEVSVELTHLGDVMGTPDYMAPEQAVDPHQADIRADIYSLGCTLYMLLTGKTPFGYGSAQTKMQSKQFAEPRPITELRADLPPGLVAVLNKMTAFDPRNRYQTPAEVVKVLAPFARPTPYSKTAPIPAAPPASPPAATPSPPAKKQPTVAAPSPAPVPVPTTVAVADPARKEADNFLARCPFCLTRIRIPARALGASLPCPHCGSYFTAVPEEDRAALR